MTLQKDQEVWERERARLDDEVARARAMENEAYERYEVPQTTPSRQAGTGGQRLSAVCVPDGGWGKQVVEHQRQKVAKEVETLEKEVEELKAGKRPHPPTRWHHYLLRSPSSAVATAVVGAGGHGPAPSAVSCQRT